MKENDLRVVKTKQNIRSSYLGLLRKKKHSQITVQDICDGALCSRNTFYMHYQDKETLREVIVNECVDTMRRAFVNESSNFAEITEKVVLGYSTSIITSASKTGDVMRAMLLSDDSGFLREKLAEAILEECIKGGQKLSKTNAESAAYRLNCNYLISGMLGFVISWIKETNYSAQEATALLQSIHTSVVQRMFEILKTGK